MTNQNIYNSNNSHKRLKFSHKNVYRKLLAPIKNTQNYNKLSMKKNGLLALCFFQNWELCLWPSSLISLVYKYKVAHMLLSSTNIRKSNEIPTQKRQKAHSMDTSAHGRNHWSESELHSLTDFFASFKTLYNLCSK